MLGLLVGWCVGRVRDDMLWVVGWSVALGMWGGGEREFGAASVDM